MTYCYIVFDSIITTLCHCTSAAVLIGCHAQRNGPMEKYENMVLFLMFTTIKIDVFINYIIIIFQIRSSLKIVETPPNEVL